MEQSFFLSKPNQRIILHAGFWAFLLVEVYLYNISKRTPDFVFTYLIVFFFINSLLVYFNLYFLYKKLFLKGRLWQYLTSVSILVLIGACIITNFYYSTTILKEKHYLFFIFNILFIQALATGAKFFKTGIYNHFYIQQLRKEQYEAELRLLRSQLNPHFMFNTLNNIYSLTLQKSNAAPEAVMQLSELMRYMTKASASIEKVSLTSELVQIKNYIELEKLRLNKDNIQYLEEGSFEEAKIHTLILLPFIENAFKHGVSEQAYNSDLQVRILLKGERLHFTVRNSKPERQDFTRESGVGLENVKRRLELLYKNCHTLLIDDAGKHFTIQLDLQL